MNRQLVWFKTGSSATVSHPGIGPSGLNIFTRSNCHYFGVKIPMDKTIESIPISQVLWDNHLVLWVLYTYVILLLDNPIYYPIPFWLSGKSRLILAGVWVCLKLGYPSMNWFIMIFSIENGRKFRGPVVHTPVSDMKSPMNSTCSIRFYPITC